MDKRKYETRRSAYEKSKRIKILEHQITQEKEKQKTSDHKIKLLEKEIDNGIKIQSLTVANLNSYILKYNSNELILQHECEISKNTIKDLEQKIEDISELYLRKSEAYLRLEKQLVVSQYDLENYSNKYNILIEKYDKLLKKV